MKSIIGWVQMWGWWGLEQFAVIFLNGTEKQNADTGVMEHCAICWWYRGVFLGILLGCALMFMSGAVT